MPSDTKPQLTPYDEKIIEDVVTEGVGTENLDPDRVVEEKALVRKLDFRILPIACLLYFCSFLDRSNLGNARLQGLPEDALGGDPTGKLFDVINSVFFTSYVRAAYFQTQYSPIRRSCRSFFKSP
ncbi:hypothetical protein Ac2012v2_006511 [Leucoagaricus gongylophorus]